jgi:hypothetical protein
MLPFTRAEFFELFAAYSAAIWPAQAIAYVLGGVAVAALARPGAAADRTIAATLAAMWLWTGIAYHALFFARINALAPAFGAAFVLQGILFAVASLRRPPSFRRGSRLHHWIGATFVAYAALLYPLLGTALGHTWPALPMFGVTPCPVTIFTFGLLLYAQGVPWWLFAVPLLWSLVGGSAAFLLSVPQDWLMLLAGGPAVIALAMRRAGSEGGSH